MEVPPNKIRQLEKRAKFLISAFSIVLGIMIFSISMEKTQNLQTNVLVIPEISVETIIENTELKYGTESEVYRFKIDATAPFTIRYLTFQFSHSGLDWTKFDSADDWKMYEVVNGEIDYSVQVGEGTELSDNGILKMKMFSSGKRDVGFVGEKNTFVLVTDIIKTGGDTSFGVMTYTDGMSWVWGAYNNSWGTLEKKLGADSIKGLPTNISSKI